MGFQRPGFCFRVMEAMPSERHSLFSMTNVHPMMEPDVGHFRSITQAGDDGHSRNSALLDGSKVSWGRVGGVMLENLFS